MARYKFIKGALDKLMGGEVDPSRRNLMKGAGAAGALVALPKGAKKLMGDSVDEVVQPAKKVIKSLPKKLVNTPAFDKLKTDFFKHQTLHRKLTDAVASKAGLGPNRLTGLLEGESWEDYMARINEDDYRIEDLMVDKPSDTWKEISERFARGNPLGGTGEEWAEQWHDEIFEENNISVDRLEGWFEGKNSLEATEVGEDWGGHDRWWDNIEDYEGFDLKEFVNTMMEDYGLSKQRLANYLRKNKLIYRDLEDNEKMPKVKEYVEGASD